MALMTDILIVYNKYFFPVTIPGLLSVGAQNAAPYCLQGTVTDRFQ
jgi:hypothetical protein